MAHDDRHEPQRPPSGLSPFLVWGILGVLVIAIFVLVAGAMF